MHSARATHAGRFVVHTEAFKTAGVPSLARVIRLTRMTLRKLG